MITIPIWVLILWGFGWAHFGYSNAKYTRKKRQAQLLSVAELLVALAIIAYYVKGG